MRRLTCLLGVSLFLALGAPAPVRGEESKFFPISSVRPGMRGYGLTVKSGTRIERFDVEVVDVMRNFLAKQDMILVRCLGDEFAVELGMRYQNPSIESALNRLLERQVSEIVVFPLFPQYASGSLP